MLRARSAMQEKKKFLQAHYKAASFSIDTDIVSRGSMQQLLTNGLDPQICFQKVDVLLENLLPMSRRLAGSQPKK